MVFENKNLEILACNFVGIEIDKAGFLYFKRFTDKQLEIYAKNSLFRMMSQNAAGVYLSFKTNGSEIRFQCKKEAILKNIIPILIEMGLSKIIEVTKNSMKQVKQHGGRMKMDDAFDIYINGERVVSPKPKSGKIKVSFHNSAKSDIFVKIYFPLYAKVGIMNLTSNGSIKAISESKEKIYCLGDSITQGFDAGNPSLCYVAKVAETLNLDALNQGIGGYQYDAAILDGFEKLPSPKFVTIAYGTNDWGFNPSMDSIQENICNFYKKINTLFPDIPVFVITPIWRGDMDMPQQSGEFMDVVHLIEKETSKYSNVVLVDGLKISPHDKSYYSDRRLHPNANGFAYMTERLIPIFASAFDN